MSGLGESKAKVAWEAYRPKLKKCPDLLVKPSLDEVFYIRLRSIKSSSASKPISTRFKRFVVARNTRFNSSSLYVSSEQGKKKKKTKVDSNAIRTTLKLWAVLYHNITIARRQNILSHIYPQYVGLLDDKSILPTSRDHLFRPNSHRR